jgi:spore coat polysaccharide biosynthesis predicted glycosyltransferase SpsG
VGDDAAVSITADAFPEAGLGHLSRSSAIAAALGCRGLTVECQAYGATESFVRDGVHWAPWDGTTRPPGQVLVVDSYRLGGDDLRRASDSRPVVVLHDTTDVPPNAALVISVGAEGPADRRWLSGFEFVALRPGFWGLPAREVHERVERILVTTGGGSFGSLARDLASDVAQAVPDARVTLVLGPHATFDAPPGVDSLAGPDSLLRPLLGTDLVVTAGGQTLLEAAATGAPCVALPVVENQRTQVERLAKAGAVHPVDVVREDLGSAVARLASDGDVRRELSRSAQIAIDGYGALRIGFRIARLLEASP